MTNQITQQQRIDAVNLLVDHAFQTNPILLRGVCRVLGMDMQFHLFEEMGMAIFDTLTEDIGCLPNIKEVGDAKDQ